MLQTLKQLNREQLKEWYMETPSTELSQLDSETLGYVLEELTPYKRKPWHTVGLINRLLSQWFLYEESWEVYPVSRRDMFLKYERMTGELPEISLPTLTLFNHFIAIGGIQ